MKTVFISSVLWLLNGVVNAQDLSLLENPFNIDSIDCLPIHVSTLDFTTITDTCYGRIYVKGEYMNGLKRKVFANKGEYLYCLNYKDGKVNGQQIVVNQDSSEIMIVNYTGGVEHGWSIMVSKDPIYNSSSFYFNFSLDEKKVSDIDYENNGVPLSYKFCLDIFTYEVLFYRSGMPASYVIQKGNECIYAATYYETGLIWKENEGLIVSKVGQGDWAIGIHSLQRSNLMQLVNGRHTEYDQCGALIVEEFVR